MKKELKDTRKQIDKLYELEGELKQAAIDAIYDIAMLHGGTLSFEDIDDTPFISYDGGNHIEYASNMCNEVKSVKAYISKCGHKKFSCVTEEDEDYNVSRITNDDVFYLFDTIYSCEENGLFDEKTEIKIWNGGYSETDLLGFEIITWSESQSLFEMEGFENHAFLINDEEGLEMYGSSAYVVDCEWYYSFKKDHEEIAIENDEKDALDD